jgi:hypothetical protein
LTTALELDEAARPTGLIEACSKYPNFALEVLGQAYAVASPANDQRAKWVALREAVGNDITMYRS